MRKEFQERLDAQACSAAHAASKDAKRKAQLGEPENKLAACSRGGPAGDSTHATARLCNADMLPALCTCNHVLTDSRLAFQIQTRLF